MKPSYAQATIVGAVLGVVLAIATFLFVGATGGIPKLEVIGEGASIEPAFAVPASAMWIVVLIAGAIGGLILAVATKAVSRVIDPDTKGAPMVVVASLGLVVGAVLAVSVFPLGTTVLGTLADGTATLSVVDMTILTVILGLSGGAVIVWQSYIMARPPQHEPDPELLSA